MGGFLPVWYWEIGSGFMYSQISSAAFRNRPDAHPGCTFSYQITSQELLNIKEFASRFSYCVQWISKTGNILEEL